MTLLNQNPKNPELGRTGSSPPNVVVGVDTVILGDYFKRCHSKKKPALVIGDHCTMDGVHFALGERARMVIGDYCYFTNAVLLCELEVRIDDYVVLAGMRPSWTRTSIRSRRRNVSRTSRHVHPWVAARARETYGLAKERWLASS